MRVYIHTHTHTHTHTLYVCVYTHTHTHTHTQKVKFIPEQAMKTQTASRCIPLLFNPGATWGQVVTAKPRPLYRRERDPLFTVQEAG